MNGTREQQQRMDRLLVRLRGMIDMYGWPEDFPPAPLSAWAVCHDGARMRLA